MRSQNKRERKNQWECMRKRAVGCVAGACGSSEVYFVISQNQDNKFNLKKSCTQYKQIQEETYFKNSLPPKLF